MEPFFVAYTAVWVTTCVLALILVLTKQAEFSFYSKQYLLFVSQPWKLLTFVIACMGFILIAPYAGDPTWDYVDATFMSVLTFLTAPWAVGILYKTMRGSASPEQGFVALCLWMFSASWSYDLYLVIRDGYYPITWLTNVAASSVLYAAAGMFWNLDYRPGRGVTFSFLEPEWFVTSSFQDFRKAFWYALPFMLLVSAAVLSFLWTQGN